MILCVLKITQTLLGRGPNFNEPCGNCLQAALASILELPLDQVPHFCDVNAHGLGYDWYAEMNAWLEQRFGLMVVYIHESEWKPTGFHLLSGTSPRGSQHETVGYNGELAHDPHPIGGGVSGERHIGLFVSVNPARQSRGIASLSEAA